MLDDTRSVIENPQSSVGNRKSKIENPQSVIENPQSSVGNRQSKIENPQSAIENPQSKILVIEDNEQNLYLTTFILEKHGYEIIQAREGGEGIRLAGLAEPDLILLDIQLPEMDGYAVAQALRSNPALDDVPIVAVTSYAMAGDRERILAAGCTGYIEKPINPDTFVAQVAAHLPDRPSGSGDGT